LLGFGELDNLQVVLVSARNPLNVGAVARAMSNFGFGRLSVVNPYRMAFREARSAVGASQVLQNAHEYDKLPDAISDCTLVVGTTAVRSRHLLHSLKRLEEGAKVIRKALKTNRVALLFGSEKFGLSNDDFSHCDWLMQIPTSKQNISMNLGHAVAVCLYELVRDTRVEGSVPQPKPSLATAGEAERICMLFSEIMYMSGYLKRKPTRDAEERIRRLVRRLRIPAGDVSAWLGILRQALWKMQNPS